MMAHPVFTFGFRWIVALPLLFGSLIAESGESSIPWKTGREILPTSNIENISNAITAAHSGSKHCVVQFYPAPDARQRETLADRGLRLLRYIGNGAYFASLESGIADAARIAEVSTLTGIAPIRVDWKLHPSLISAHIPDWATAGTNADGTRRIALYVIFHADVELNAAIALVAARGATLVDTLPTVNGLVIEINENAVASIAAEDEIQWIEPPLPILSVTNDGVRATTQADQVRIAPYDLDGSGVTVLVYDGGTARVTHRDFEGRLVALDGSGTINHATHVAGTIGGGGIANPLYRGMAPGVEMLSYGLQGVGSEGPLYTNPGDIESDFADAINNGAMLSNASLGSNVEANGFDCAWQGDYGVTDALIDGIVRGSLGVPFRAVWSAGNERPGYRCNVEGFGEYYSIAPPAGAKNHMTVGAVNSNDESMTTFSSWGPTDDGRLKPDVCAPGCQAGGDYGVTSCSAAGDSSYTTYCGTSMASPAVCGLAALVLQDYQEQFPGQPLPRNSLLRGLFAHTAVDLGNPGPDYCFGYGSVRVRAAIDLLREGRFHENAIDQGDRHSWTVNIESGTPELKVTLAWDDVPAVPNAAVALVNDLDLEVTGPDGTRYYPWTLDPQTPNAPAVRTQADHLNNIEQVWIGNPLPGQWTIAVAGNNIPDGPQPYSLVGDGAVNVTTVIAFPNGLPDLIAPGTTYELDVYIAAFGQELVPGTARLYYSVNNGEFAALPLSELSGNLYRATLPPRNCGEVPSYYVYVESTASGVATLPANAPTTTFSHMIGVWTPLFSDDFEEAGDWSVYAGAITGNWERADPEQVVSLGVVTQPEDDHTSGAGTHCYVTGPLAGLHASMYDVDGGPSHLISPVFDLAERDALVSYWRWYHMSTNLDDELVVSITNDGVNWTTVEQVRRSLSEWVYAEWRVSDFIAPTATVQLRFTVNDTDPGSLIEALVDDFALVHVTCGNQAVLGDLDGDGDVDLNDLAQLLGHYGMSSGAAYTDGDLDGDGDVDLSDLAALLGNYGTGV